MFSELTAALLAATAPALSPATAIDSPPSAGDAPETEEAGESDDAIIVQATRSRRRLQDDPVRVEVIDRDEIEEKILMRPGSVAMVLSETGGLRVQVTSPALGSANIRVQGMEGRYTQLLADGLPLYGGQASSLGLLQIPPTDLGRVEVIKGAASALYGASALGGVINLVSRKPGADLDAELLLNATSRNGQDATAYLATPLAGGWSASITGGVHRQRWQDLDSDGWADIAGFQRWTARPRLFWSDDAGSTLFVTLGAMREERRGGTLPGQTVPDGQPFRQDQDSKRFDGGLIAETPIEGVGTLQFRASGMTQRHNHRFGSVIERDRHATLFAEASIAGGEGSTTWAGGVAYQRDAFRSRTFPAFDYAYRVPGLFAQVERELAADLTLAGSARLDFHSDYGTRASPRLSLLYKPGRWTIRASGGSGFFAPNPFVEEIEDAGLSRLEPLAGLRAETARSGSLDVGYAIGRLEVNATLFASDMRGTADLIATSPTSVRLVNRDGTTRIRGGELLIRRRFDAITVTGSYVHIDASEIDPVSGRRQRMPLTPRHTAGTVAMWERPDVGRIGIELYYTGGQRLDDNPYRTRSRPYFELGMLAEKVIGRARLFINAENILGVRQTRFDPLLRPVRGPDGRWTVDVWGPTEGFVLNGGVRLKL